MPSGHLFQFNYCEDIYFMTGPHNVRGLFEDFLGGIKLELALGLRHLVVLVKVTVKG